MATGVENGTESRTRHNCITANVTPRDVYGGVCRLPYRENLLAYPRFSCFKSHKSSDVSRFDTDVFFPGTPGY